MSSPHKPVSLGFLADRFFYGVFIVTMKTIMAALIAFPLAVLYPVLGVAEAPEAVKMEQAINAEDQRIAEAAGSDGNIFTKSWGWVTDKAGEAKAGAGAMVDGLFNKDEAMLQMEAERDQWRAQALEYRNQLSEQRVQQGLRHDMMVQCTKDLTQYLLSIPKK